MMGRGDLALDLDLDMDYEGNPIITACVDQVLEAAISCGIPRASSTLSNANANSL